MFAIVEDGAIVRTASTVQKLFNYSVPDGAGIATMSEFMSQMNVKDVVNGEMKDGRYYYVTAEDIALVDGVPTQAYTNTAKRLADEDSKDDDGNQLYVQVWDADANDGDGGYVNSSEKIIKRGLKTNMTEQVKTVANSLLAKTDWMVIRKAERDVAIPSATATYRAAVLTECARLETAITNAADVDALAVVMAAQDWPRED
tara:strand:- start:1649 stop:2251 length:603 start_codon:yes stop_codon:yes gene_type:complete